MAVLVLAALEIVACLVIYGLEQDALERSNLDTLADAIDVTAEVARALEAAGGAVELVAAVGDLVDAGGTVLEGVGNLFEALNA